MKTIHIIGGGVAGCTAAYWLTNEPGWKQKYEVKIYQSGWRLGGKGASGRHLENGKRSLEHGPHAWYGGYENAFRTMEQVFGEYLAMRGSHGPFKKLFGEGQDALFRPATEACYLKHQEEEGEPVWVWRFPNYTGNGTPGDENDAPGLLANLERLLRMVIINVRKERLEEKFRTSMQTLYGEELRESELDFPVSLETWVELTIDALSAGEDVGRTRAGLKLLKFLQDRMAQLDQMGVLPKRLAVMFDYLLALACGTVREILIGKKEFDELNTVEFQEFLSDNNSRYPTTADSRFVRGLYEAAFAYRKGRTANLAAGTALRISLWILFGYKANYIYKMQAGMGEAVFTPLYEVVKERGADFHFFHRVTQLKLDEHKARIRSIEFEEQARARGGSYEPLVDASVAGAPFWCWPHEPKWTELEDGDELSGKDAEPVDLESRWTAIKGEKKELPLGEDDIVLLALPVPTVPEIVEELAEASPRFKAMLDGIDSVATVAGQLWVEKRPGDQKPFAEFGIDEELIAGGSEEPLGIFLDYSPILATEDDREKHLIYTCGVLPDPRGLETPVPGSPDPAVL